MVDEYAHVFSFSVLNSRSAGLIPIRQEFKSDSRCGVDVRVAHSLKILLNRVLFGKRRIMSLGLGRTPEEECAKDLHKMSRYLVGHCGLLFTNREPEDIVSCVCFFE